MKPFVTLLALCMVLVAVLAQPSQATQSVAVPSYDQTTADRLLNLEAKVSSLVAAQSLASSTVSQQCECGTSCPCVEPGSTLPFPNHERLNAFPAETQGYCDPETGVCYDANGQVCTDGTCGPSVSGSVSSGAGCEDCVGLPGGILKNRNGEPRMPVRNLIKLVRRRR